MKIELDKKGRKLYKFSHSVHQGGFFYCHKAGKRIDNKGGLRNALNAIATKLNLIDVTIKIYEDIFFIFFMTKPLTKPIDIIQTIQKNITGFADWDKEYLYNTVYDLQEEYLREDIKKLGFNYDEG